MATVTYPDKSFIAAVGPLKLEFVWLTSVSNAESYSSKLVTPLGAVMFPVGDMGGTAWTGSTAVSGQTITMHDPNVVTSVLLIVVGF